MEREYIQSNVNIKSFRGDNGVQKIAEFRAKINKNDEFVTLCGTGTHHQSEIAERYIKTKAEKTRTVLLHVHARLTNSIDMEL